MSTTPGTPKTAATPRPPRHAVVIGGGIAGLAAAWQLRETAPDTLRVTVLESADRVGGKLSTRTLAGTVLDDGCESMMSLRPEAVRLAEAVGLGGDLLPPAAAPTTVWTRGALRALPPGHVMGVPTDPDALAATGLLSAAGVDRLRREPALPAVPVVGDITVGRYLTDRLGPETVDRIVEPLLGGIYAGRTELLSLEAVMPRLLPFARRGTSLLDGLRAAWRDAPQGPPPQVVTGLRGGVGRLPAAVAASLAGSRDADIRTGTRVVSLWRSDRGWHILAETGQGPLELIADAVVLALPAHPAGRLLAPHAPAVAGELSGYGYAATAVVTLAFDRRTLPAVPRGNGFLVPPVDGRTVKAATFTSNKWSAVAEADPGTFHLRTSIGRFGAAEDLARSDDELVRRSLADLGDALGGPLGDPSDAAVTHWPDGLPQYTVGHQERVARIRAGVAHLPGLAVCGAAYDGVGVAACVASGQRAAAEVLTAVDAGR
ncbi:protoporphyrinogen oxidase [Streptomyces celluloflavus]|uniref:protoporphyrinogen oxidase n=1 Tax=Streptomyces celluloflavus TaxID=58344 RepID=UPI0036877BE1